MDRKRHGGIRAINTGTASIDKMLDTMVSATFKDVGKADNIAIDIGERIFDGVAHSGLGGQIDHPIGLVGLECSFNGDTISKVNSQMCVIGMA